MSNSNNDECKKTKTPLENESLTIMAQLYLSDLENKNSINKLSAKISN